MNTPWAETKYSVSNFFVKPDLHNRGIGRFLFKKIFKTTKEKKAEILHVPSSRNGIGFYEKMGFVDENETFNVKRNSKRLS